MNNESFDISVVIPTYNRVERLPSVLEAWRASSENAQCSHEIIFSDDGSEDKTEALLESVVGLPVKYIKNQHRGASFARNAAIQQATGRRIVFVGDDIFPDPEFIHRHFLYGAKYGDKVAVLGRVDWHPKQFRNYLLDHIAGEGNEQFSFNRMRPNTFTDFRHFYTCNVSVSRKMLDTVDIYFDERFYKVNFEDTELSYRLCNNGMRIIYKPDVFGFHYHEYTAEKFCARQKVAGEMAVVLRDLHPELDSMLGVDKTCAGFRRYRESKGRTDSTNYSSYSQVLDICESLENRLNGDVEQKDRRLTKSLLSLLYGSLFELAYREGMLEKQVFDDSELIEPYLNARYLGRSLRDALLAEYYFCTGLVTAFRRHLLFSGRPYPGDTEERCYSLMNSIISGLFGEDISDPEIHSINKQILMNRMLVRLKRVYSLWKVKFLYDFASRRLFLIRNKS